MNKDEIILKQDKEIQRLNNDLNVLNTGLIQINDEEKKKYKQALLDIKEYIENVKWFRDDQILVDILHPYLDKVLEIIDKALGLESEVK